MLLLMIDANLDDPRQLRSGFNAARKQLFEPGVHMRAVGEDAIAGRPREEPAHSPRLAGPMRFIIGVEAIVEGRIEQVILLEIQGENESLEEPGRMRQMPFRRAGVVHRLDGHVLGAKRLGEVERQPPCLEETGAERA